MDFDYHGNYDWINKEIEKHYSEIEDKEKYKVKPVKIFITAVDSKCNFEIKKKSENLILLRHDLTGNYKIDRKESEKILEGIDM